MKKILLMFALAAFIGANNVSTAVAATSGITKVECEKCGKDPCTKKCKKEHEQKGEAKTCNHGSSGNTAATEGETPKSCAGKKSCCKGHAKAEGETGTKKEEAAPSAK